MSALPQRAWSASAHHAEQTYRAFFDQMNEGAVILLADGTITGSNGRFAAMVQTAPARVIGSSLRTFVGPDDRDRLMSFLAQGSVDSCKAEFRLRSGEGSGCWAQLSLSPMALDGGIRLCLVASDITERRAKEEERAYAASIVDSTGDAVIGRDLDGIVVSWNAAAERMYGYTAAEIVGRPIATLAPHELNGEVAALLERITRSGTVDHFETERLCKDGRRIDVSLTISPVRDAEGRIIGASTIARDIGARKRDEAALRQRAAELKAAPRSARLGRWGLDRANGRMSWSKELYRLAGLDPSEPPPCAAELDTVFTPSSLKRINRSAIRILKTGTPVELEAEFVRRDGSGAKGWVLLRAEAARDVDGLITGLRGIALDISERKETEERLKRQAALLDDLYNRAPCGYHSLDPYGVFVRINDTELAMLGFSREEVVGRKRFSDLLTPEGVPRFLETFSRLKEQGEVDGLEFQMVRKDGSIISVLLQSMAVLGPHGQFLKSRATLIDVTERHRAEQALQDRERELREAQEIALLGNWKWDLQAETATWSEQALRIFGCDPNRSAFGLAGVRETISLADQARCRALAEKALITGEPYESDLQVLRPDGTFRWIVLRGVVEHDAQGRTIGLHGTVQDITARKWTEQVLQKQQEELRKAQRIGKVGSWQFLPATKTHIWSRETYRIYGLNPNLPLPSVEERWAVFTPESRARLYAAWDDLLAKGTPAELELQFRHPNGEERWIVWRGEAAHDGHGGTSILRGTLQDITERKRAEEQLRSLNENLERLVAERTADLQAILDAAPIPIWIAHDAQCRHISANAIGDRLLSGRAPYRICAKGRELRQDESPLRRAAATGQAIDNQEVELLREDGSAISLLLSAAPLFDAEGRVRGAVAAGSDVTALRKEEKARRDSEERLALALRASQDGVWDWNLETNTAWYSPRWKEILGYQEQEIEPLVGAWERLLHPADKQRSLLKVEEIRRGASEFAIEFRLRHKNGHYVPILARGIPVQRPDGGPVTRIVGTNFELTERKVHEALRRVSAYHRSLIEANLDPMVTISPDGKIADVNSAAERAIGLPRMELIGTDFSNYFTDPEKARAADQLAFRDGWVKDHELEIQHRDGHALPVLYNASLFCDEAGQPAGVFAAARDISQRKRAEEALIQQTEELGRSNAELQQFAFIASHDLQEPLRAVSNFTGLLSLRYAGKLDADADEYIKFAAEGAKRAQVLILDLLAFSRAGSRGGALSPVDCEAVMGDTLSNLSSAIEESGGQVTHDPLPVVEGNRTQLGQVFQNLVGNALKFRGSEAPRVHVSAHRLGSAWQFSVRDNGIGIDPRHVGKIFQLFQRLHTRAEYPGTGIGLAVVKKVVERQGGRIWVESALGRGSTFHFTIPAV
jgi:PAS domain S-box-containing protein